MPIHVLMPALSPTMTEGNLVKWHKTEGDAVKAGDLLAEIETDKATMEVEAVDEGTLAKILVLAGTDNVPVNQLIALILEEGEDASTLEKSALENITSPQKLVPVASAPTPSLPDAPVTLPSKPVSSGERVFISPLAKRLALHHNLEISNVGGSGPKGRVIKADIEKALQSAAAKKPEISQGGYTDVKLNSMRKTIAKRLTESKQTIPHFYVSVDCTLDALLTLRRQINELPGSTQKVSVNDFVIRACALALIKVPEANVTWHDTFVRQYQNADVAVAVAVEGGLITPIVRCAEQKSLLEISAEVRSLAERARAGHLLPEEYQGGSFSLSNLGMYGVRDFSAIINPPQACILAVGAGEQRTVVKEGQLQIATLMTCTLSVDHRAVDGALGAQFLKTFKELIENPLTLVV
ncbi:pyruvate dehydrogenase complex dihydrolipoamide acetyltransferase [Candidatus Finniella inopinata]|uniref:Acetyltransferase component of pyruvate dehydrogenase complex n=1 Tax=Candidatus Finniella inopinata TaxID=1696036 RepID=A0A4Q7DGV2_9PROT|nr:pyruvate dehydrogenase complex dihydrolipoamide acetyltransferase [Candidatus Finniella inopinata]RZI45510.1 pyruvate dehydrogenase complex dihydrolipoamide acetyltransferase [Candidatus Finniella inopinata]